MKIGFILLIVAVVILVVLICGCVWMVHFITKPKQWTLEDYKQRIQDEGVTLEHYYHSRRDVLNVFSDFGYELHGFLMQQPEPCDQYVIVTHGYSSNRWESLPYANVFYELGYNVYLYDIRHHGDNEKSFCSMGYYEHMDIIAIAEELRRRFGNQIEIGLCGVSLGAASSIWSLRLWQGFSFCVADCGFCDLKLLMKELSRKWFHLPGLFVYPVAAVGVCMYHFNLLQVKPVEALSVNRTTPVMFIHGSADDFILPEHSKRFYEAAQGYKELHLIEGAQHAESVLKAPEQYKAFVEGFLKQIGQI